MNPLLQPLIRLQSFDLRSTSIKEQRRKLPALLQAAENPLREAQRRLEKAAQTAEVSLKVRRERERELEAHETHIEKMKARTSEIKKNVEYQAHLFEIQMANKKKGEIEEQILLLMDEVDQRQRALQQAKDQAAEAEAAFNKQKAELETLEAKLAEELDTLEEQQKEGAETVDKSLLERHQKLKGTRKELAVVPVQEGNCSGCRLQLPPQLVAEVKRSEKIVACSFCERILYWEEDSPAPPDSIRSEREKLHEQV